MTIDYTCGKCGHDFSVVVTLQRRAVIRRDPEASEPPQAGSVSPDSCPECGQAVHEECAFEMANNCAYADAMERSRIGDAE